MPIPLSQWSRLYDLADKVFALKPWERLLEDKLFAIQPELTGPVYFVSIMGGLGEYLAVAFYEGAEGLMHFKSAQSEILSEELRMEEVLLNTHLQLSFEPNQGVEEPDRLIFKSLKRRYRGKWPLFRSHQAARIPWFISTKEADLFELLLEQTLVGLERARIHPELLRDFDEPAFFLRLRTASGTWEDGLCEVAKLPRVRRILRAEFEEHALRGIPRGKQKFEMELRLLLAPMSEVPAGEAPYLPYLVLAVDAETGMVIGFDSISTEEGPDAALVRLPEVLCNLFKKAGIVPAKLAARHPVLFSALKTMGEVYKIKLELDEDLPMATQAMESLMQAMQR